MDPSCASAIACGGSALGLGVYAFGGGCGGYGERGELAGMLPDGVRNWGVGCGGG